MGNSTKFLYTTIHCFKGLECLAVIIVELDEGLLDENENATCAAQCYVDFSNPRNHLILLGKESVIQELLPPG